MRAAYLMGAGDRANNLFDMTVCNSDRATLLTASEMRAVNGEADGFFGLNVEGVRKQLQRTVGAVCAGQDSCEQPGGGGWHVVRHGELKDKAADHCYFFDAANNYCSEYKGLDPNWATGSAPWALRANLDWLSSQVVKTEESVPEVSRLESASAAALGVAPAAKSRGHKKSGRHGRAAQLDAAR